MASKPGKRVFPDDDIPEMTDASFAAAKPLMTDMPEVVEAMKRGRGRPKVESPKARVSLRLDPKIVAAYKATGEGWQSRINEILARALPQHKPKRRSSKAA
ncbi:MAG TPA: BrnA antitoxin family protein [Rhizomicrobium sp.]|nr:BrnA antitoxin family protein [Rhizomicrobium sp.]